MQDISWLDKLLELGEHWPDLTCVLIGSVAAVFLTLAFERYWLPTATDAAVIKAQKGTTFLFGWIAAGTFSTALWAVWDPKDSLRVILVTSYIVGLLPWSCYPIIARIATKYVPAIGSSWAVKPP